MQIENLLIKLYKLYSPYLIKNGVRYYRNTNMLVREATRIIVIDNNDKKTMYRSFTDCAKSLKIGRKIIKHCLNTGQSHKGYNFVLN